MFVVFPGRNTSCSGTKTSRPAELKVKGRGSKNFPSGSLGVIVKGIIPFQPLDSWTHGPWLWEKPYYTWMLIQSIHCPLENPIQVLRLLPPNWSCNRVFKRPFHCPIRYLVENMFRPWIPWLWAHYCPSLAMKWVPWSEVIMCRILRQWKRHSVSTQMVSFWQKHYMLERQIFNQNKYLLH